VGCAETVRVAACCAGLDVASSVRPKLCSV
jgi:hypothetical protein